MDRGMSSIERPDAADPSSHQQAVDLLFAQTSPSNEALGLRGPNESISPSIAPGAASGAASGSAGGRAPMAWTWRAGVLAALALVTVALALDIAIGASPWGLGLRQVGCGMLLGSLLQFVLEGLDAEKTRRAKALLDPSKQTLIYAALSAMAITFALRTWLQLKGLT
jgi:hypothetical protein